MLGYFDTIVTTFFVTLGCLFAFVVALTTDVGNDGNAVSVGGSTLNNGKYIVVYIRYIYKLKLKSIRKSPDTIQYNLYSIS